MVIIIVMLWRLYVCDKLMFWSIFLVFFIGFLIGEKYWVYVCLGIILIMMLIIVFYIFKGKILKEIFYVLNNIYIN